MRPIDYFDTAVDSFSERTAIIDDTLAMSFDDLCRHTHRAARALAPIANACNRAPVAIYAPNDYRVVIATLACMRAGAPVAPVHARTATMKNVEYLRTLQPACVMYHSSARDAISALKSSGAAVSRYVCIDSDECGDASLASFSAAAAGEFADWGDVYGNPEHPVYIRQTSGTTGAPKLIVGDVASFDATHLIVRQMLQRSAGDEPVCLVAAPLSHAAGVHAFCMLTLGARLIIRRDFNAIDIIRSIERHRVTHIWLPGTALALLLKALGAVRADVSSIRSVVLGASSVAPDNLRAAVERFGPCVSVNYSQIESGFLTWLDETVIQEAIRGHRPERLASSGTSLYVGRIGIMDDEGRLMPKGATGEIVVRGRSVKPYIRRPYVPDDEELARAHRGGWHHTGDVGFIDRTGYLYVVGRLKDMINVGGIKVSAGEVERTICELPAVAECAVVGVPEPRRGEAVKAIITLRPGRSVDDVDVTAYCRQRLGDTHCPSSVERWTELPRTVVGKIDKRRIREIVSMPREEAHP